MDVEVLSRTQRVDSVRTDDWVSSTLYYLRTKESSESNLIKQYVVLY